jgi:regulatory protein
MAFSRINKKTKKPEDLEHAYNYALFLLGLSMRTEAEIKRKMELRGYVAKIIIGTIKKLYEEKLLDDHNYTEVYINNLKQYKNFGYYGIRKKLMEKQLPKTDIEELLEQELTLEEELKLGKRLLQKELGASYKKTQLTQEQKQKFGRRLQSRGFRMDIISKLLF